MKQLCLFLITIIMCNSISQIFLSKNTFISAELIQRQRKDSNKLMQQYLNIKSNEKKKYILPIGPLFWQGWIKYFHYKSSGGISRPTNFFINSEFKSQKVTHKERTIKDKLGYIHIPTKFHFYAKFLKNGFNILSSRSFDVLQTNNNINIDMILPPNKNEPSKSSIRDLGKFNEGTCILINTLVPKNCDKKFESLETNTNGSHESWIICVEDPKEQVKLFNLFINLKLSKMKKSGRKKENKDKPENKKTMAEILGGKPTLKMEKYKGPGASANDGYLLLLNDWSQCTLKCGGGLTYQQWRCIPPKTGGRPCKGDLIRKRPCNQQNCPGSIKSNGINISKKNQNNENVTLPPIIRSLPFSTRPQQYVKCVVRENDVLYVKQIEEEPGKFRPYGIPSRIVLNKRTISVFGDDKYTDAVFNFNLQTTTLSADPDDDCCFQLCSENKTYTICSFDSKCPGYVSNWNNSFNLFKLKCFDHQKNEEASKSVGLSPGKNDSGNLLSGMGIDEATANGRTGLVKKKLEEQSEANFQKKMTETEVVALKAIKKELNIEELIKSEMRLKNKREADELVSLLKREQKKKDMLENIFKEREAQDAHVREIKESKNQLLAIKLEAKKEIEKKRNSLRKTIQEIKKKGERRKRLIEQQINVIRAQMATRLVSANKVGDIVVCKNGMNSQKEIELYCNNNIVDDVNINADCKTPSSFCYVCCENEFGNMALEKRDKCYNMCDKSYSQQLNFGEFIWKK